MPSLDAPGVATLVAERIKNEIDAYCVRTYGNAYREHLGASLIGRECPRELWYTFRWYGGIPHDGRILRLFNRGHREEERFVEWLRGIGFTVEQFDEDGNQFRVVGVNGHFGGSQDGAGIFPPDWDIAEKILLEFKTSGTGPKFANLLRNGVIVEKQDHFGQMSVYGRKRNIRYCLYLAINKNDDDLHVEIVKLDWKLAEQLEARAQHVIASPKPPERLSESRTFFKCKMCSFLGVCHDKAQPDRNCRSCRFAAPADNATWVCLGPGQGQTIPSDFIPQGCGEWKEIV